MIDRLRLRPLSSARLGRAQQRQLTRGRDASYLVVGAGRDGALVPVVEADGLCHAANCARVSTA